MLDVRRLGFALGAEVRGIDLTRPVEPETSAALHQALAEHQVLVIPEQALDPDRLLAFAGTFGTLRAPRDEGEALPAHPHVIRIGNEPRSRTRWYGSVWHSDGLAFTERPDGVTFLHCVTCPSVGGDTAFANQYLAYEALSVAYRRLVRDLRWHVPRMPGIAHPIVRAHPVTGREHLYLALGARLCGFTQEESRPIVEHLNAIQTTDRFVYRHRWRTNDLVLWENATTLHRKIGDVFEGERRIMHRTATEGAIHGIRVDERSGRPIGSPIEPDDVLRLARAVSVQTEDGGSPAVVLKARGQAFMFPAEVGEFMKRVVEAEAFVARNASGWAGPDAIPWDELRAALDGLVADGLLTHDVFGDAHRLSFR